MKFFGMTSLYSAVNFTSKQFHGNHFFVQRIIIKSRTLTRINRSCSKLDDLKVLLWPLVFEALLRLLLAVWLVHKVSKKQKLQKALFFKTLLMRREHVLKQRTSDQKLTICCNWFLRVLICFPIRQNAWSEVWSYANLSEHPLLNWALRFKKDNPPPKKSFTASFFSVDPR